MCMCVGCVVWGEWMLTCYWYMFAYANVMYILALTFLSPGMLGVFRLYWRSVERDEGSFQLNKWF